MEGSLVLRVNGTNYPSPRKMGRKGVMTGLLAWNLGAIRMGLRLLVDHLGKYPVRSGHEKAARKLRAACLQPSQEKQ